MAKLVFDKEGERLYETGVNECVLYVRDAGGYGNGVAWNGITAINETPEGAEATALYADNIKYLNLISAEELNGTIEAYTYPDEFGACDGSLVPAGLTGVTVGQQARKTFGLVFKTRLGNDVSGSDYGYKLHIVYGCVASPSERAYTTINDSPEAITFSWEFSTTPVNVAGMKPTALITIDSTKVNATNLQALEALLYGDATHTAGLPDPAVVLATLGANAVPLTATITGCNGTPGLTGYGVEANYGNLVKGSTYEFKFVARDGYTLTGVTQPSVTGASGIQWSAATGILKFTVTDAATDVSFTLSANEA